MCPAREGCGSDWPEKRAFRDVYVDQVVKAIVRYDIGIAGRCSAVPLSRYIGESRDLLHYEKVDTDEHLEPEKISIGNWGR